jgi:hypothetical protein
LSYQRLLNCRDLNLQFVIFSVLTAKAVDLNKKAQVLLPKLFYLDDQIEDILAVNPNWSGQEAI